MVIYQMEASVEGEERSAAVHDAAAAVHGPSGASAAGHCSLQAPGRLPCAAPSAETVAAGCSAGLLLRREAADCLARGQPQAAD